MLRSNDDLYRYLLSLGKEFESYGQTDVAHEINVVSRLAVGSPSEFLFESQKLLTALPARCSDVLTKKQMYDLSIVISQIDEAFRRVGGA